MKYNTPLSLSLAVFLTTAALAAAQPDESVPTASAGDSFSPSTSVSVPPEVAVSSDKNGKQPDAMAIHQELSLDYGYVGGSQARNGGTHYGDSDEQQSDLKYNAAIPINDLLGVSFGVDYSRFDFGNPGAAAGIPQSLEVVSPSVGLRYKLDSQWALFGRFAPEIENLNNWSQSQYVRYTGAVGAFYDLNPDLQFTFGLAINPGTIKVPVIPLVGVRWHFEKDWTLLLGFPKSEVEYQITPKWTVGVGPSFQGGVFRTDGDYGNAIGRADLNNQHFYYREVRVGLNSEYKLTKWASITGEVGDSVYREFDFKDDNNYKVKDQPAPYGQIGLKFQL
jgi:hypothetical protein